MQENIVLLLCRPLLVTNMCNFAMRIKRNISFMCYFQSPPTESAQGRKTRETFDMNKIINKVKVHNDSSHVTIYLDIYVEINSSVQHVAEKIIYVST